MTTAIVIVAIVVVLALLGIWFFVMAWKNDAWKDGVELAAKIATIMGVLGAFIGLVFVALNYGLTVRMAKGEIEGFTAEQIEEVRNEVQKQKAGLRGLSKKVELFADGAILFDCEQYWEAAACFEKILDLEPKNELALTLVATSYSLEAREAAPFTATATRPTIAATRAKEAYLKIAEGKGLTEVAFELACVCGLLKDAEKCKMYLVLAEQAGKLPPRDRTYYWGYLDSVEHEEWFKNLKWAEPKKG